MTANQKPLSRRKTIAVLVAQLSRVWGSEFISGVMDAAQAKDVNVVCFVGGKPVAIIVPGKRTASYGLYDLVKPGEFDGILLAADLAHDIPSEDIKKFCRSLIPMPVVSFAIKEEGVSAFLADNEGSMRALIRHLIEAHHYKRIAFIRGPLGQIEADQRFKAYQEELKAHAIRLEKNLVVEGDFTPESGRSAVRILLDERGIRFEAIAASNDRMAFGALEALQQRGIQVPIRWR